MIRRRIVLMALVGMLVTALLAGIPRHAPLRGSAQEASPAASPVITSPTATPNAASRYVNTGLPPGLAVSLLSSGEAANFSLSNSSFALERLTFMAGAVAESRVATGPELLFLEAGDLQVQDELGLAATVTAGSSRLIEQGSSYLLRNPGATTVTVLRLAISGPPPGTGDGPATPTVEGPGGVSVQSLLMGDAQAPIWSGPATLFIGRATYEPEADTGFHAHPGTTGLIAETPGLLLTGPSGIEGELPVGTGVTLMSAPHRERNAGTTSVTALVAGMMFTSSPFHLPIDRPGVPAVPTVTPTPPPLAETIVGRWTGTDSNGDTVNAVFTSDGRFALADEFGATVRGHYAIADDGTMRIVVVEGMSLYGAETDVSIAQSALILDQFGITLYTDTSGSSQAQPQVLNADEAIYGTWSNVSQTWTFYQNGTATQYDHTTGQSQVWDIYFIDFKTIRLASGDRRVVAEVEIVRPPRGPDRLEMYVEGTGTSTYQRVDY